MELPVISPILEVPKKATFRAQAKSKFPHKNACSDLRTTLQLAARFKNMDHQLR